MKERYLYSFKSTFDIPLVLGFNHLFKTNKATMMLRRPQTANVHNAMIVKSISNNFLVIWSVKKLWMMASAQKVYKKHGFRKSGSIRDSPGACLERAFVDYNSSPKGIYVMSE